MKYFIINSFKFLSIGCVAILLLLLTYLYSDPFKVINDYSDYSNFYVVSNRDYISTEMLTKNYEKYNYNSFILGSSRTVAFKPNSWVKHLPKQSSPFLFDASGETVYGIYVKLKYMDSLKIDMKNALLILCRDASFRYDENNKGHISIKHPKTSKENSLIFHFAFFKAYLNPKFLISFYDYKISKKFKPYMVDYIEKRKITYDSITNEINIIDQEIELAQNPDSYYNKRKDVFYPRKGEQIDSVQRINEKNLFMLKKIKDILNKNKTNYKVVLSPLYEQIKFNPKDLLILRAVFGDSLYDFSGKNYFTESKTNFYESSHYRPFIGDSILKIIYNQKK